MRSPLKLFILIISFAIVVVLSLTSTISINAATKYENELRLQYTDIKISSGDTLENIAERYGNFDQLSKTDYIKEIKRINSLTSDTIHAGCYLTVMYYE